MWLVTGERSTSRTKGLVRPLAVVWVASLLITACGSSSGSPGTGASASNSPAAAAFEYASCMRKHGVSGYPDPQVTTNPNGSVAVAVAGPANASAAPAFRSAQKACSGLLLAQSSVNGHNGPSKQEFLAFAHCLHTHGILDFPDPNTQGQITGEMINASGVDLKAASFMTAADACVGVTHGAITRADVARVVNGPH
ncbi:MAG: hypothetical protein ACLPY3_24655 [Solirubrobacteraceae bacterium]